MKKVLLGLMLVFALVFTSCVNPSESDEKIRVRVSVTSKNGGDIGFKVFPENQYGNITTGANVYLIDSNNTYTYLEFDNDSQSYNTSLASNSTEFRVVVDSILSKEDICIQVPHIRLAVKPSITTFEDSDGNSVLSGKSVDGSKEIQLVWDSLGDDVVYTVLITTGVNQVWKKSTNASSLFVPSDVLEAGGIYYLKVSAQKIMGDPTFKSDSYYSVSEIEGSTISFSTGK